MTDTDTMTSRTTAADIAAQPASDPAHRLDKGLAPSDFAHDADLDTTLVIDLREADERIRDGSILGSIHIPRGILEFRADPTSDTYDNRLSPQQRILLYCSDGQRSTLAAASLAALGYTDLARLDGGTQAWTESALPLFGAQFAPY